MSVFHKCLFATAFFFSSFISFSQSITSGVYSIRIGSTQALDADANTLDQNGIDLMAQVFHGRSNQRWLIQPVGNNAYKIICLANGKALSAWDDNVQNNGCRVTTWDYWGGASQHWYIAPIDGKYIITCAKKASKALSINWLEAGSKTILNQKNFNSQQKWDLQLLADPANTWKAVVNGQTPPNAVIGGAERDGTPLYIARCNFKEGKHAGKAWKNSSACNISWGGKEHSVPNYEVFTGKGMWKKMPKGQVAPSGAVFAGYETDGTVVHIGRALINGTYHIGKVFSGKCYIPYGGQEFVLTEYEVLMPYVEKKGNYLAGNEQVLQLNDIRQSICPYQVLSGDRDFNGAPQVTCDINLYTNKARTKVYAHIVFRVEETSGDRSATKGYYRLKVLDVPDGKRIKRFVSDTLSKIRFNCWEAAGFQFGVPGRDLTVIYAGYQAIFDDKDKALNTLANVLGHNPQDDPNSYINDEIKTFINNGNTAFQVFPYEGYAVRTFQVVGDTGGPDISEDDDCGDDTRIVGIFFSPCIVELE